MEMIRVETSPIDGQKPGTSGLRKKTRIFMEPHSEFLEGTIALNERGFVYTGPDVTAFTDAWTLDRDPYSLETSVPGVFAAGDIREGAVRRVASAVGEGSIAVTFVHRYLDTV